LASKRAIKNNKGKKMRYSPELDYGTEAVLDEVKKELCSTIRKFALARGWNQRELAGNILASEATASRICRLRTEELTINQLFRYLAFLHPGFRLLISL
jgi:hypothetical protein